MQLGHNGNEKSAAFTNTLFSSQAPFPRPGIAGMAYVPGIPGISASWGCLTQVHVVQVVQLVQCVVHILPQYDDLRPYRLVRLEHLEQLVQGRVGRLRGGGAAVQADDLQLGQLRQPCQPRGHLRRAVSVRTLSRLPSQVCLGLSPGCLEQFC